MTAPAPGTRTRRIEGPYAKALRMYEQGYRVHPMLDENGLPIAYCYRVSRPGNRAVKDVTGDTVDSYYVNVHPKALSCDCAYFGQHGERHRCKHVHYCLLQVKEWASMLAPLADLSEVLSEIGEPL